MKVITEGKIEITPEGEITVRDFVVEHDKDAPGTAAQQLADLALARVRRAARAKAMEEVVQRLSEVMLTDGCWGSRDEARAILARAALADQATRPDGEGENG